MKTSWGSIFEGDEFTAEQATQLCRFYCRTLVEREYTPRVFPDVEIYVGVIFFFFFFFSGKFDVLNHAAWMCKEVKNLIEMKRFTKAYRWIGTIQGLLWMGGVFSWEELRTHNRKDFSNVECPIFDES